MWLPAQSNKSVISSIPQMALDLKVSELIDQDSASWKFDIVQQMFLPHEASLILGIPLSERSPLTASLGPIHPRVYSLPVVFINCLYLVIQLLLQVVQIQKLKGFFGNAFGIFELPTKSSISFGKLVIMPYQPWRTSIDATLSQQQLVKATKSYPRTPYMLSGFAKK